MHEPKFAHRIFDIFNNPAIENQYWVTVFDKKIITSHKPNQSYSKTLTTKTKIQSIAKSFGESDMFIFHYFTHDHITLYKFVSQKTCTILQLWGGDYSTHYISPINLYSKPTYAACILPQSKLKKIPNLLARLYHHLKWVMNSKSRSYRLVLTSAFHVGFELGGVEQQMFNIRTPGAKTLCISHTQLT